MSIDEPIVVSLAARHTLPEFSLVYHRPPARTTRLPTLVVRASFTHMVWLSPLSPSAPIRFDDTVVLDRGYWALWFLRQGKPYDLGKVFRSDGLHTGYYVDVLEPVQWSGAGADAIQPLTDLFLDLWIAPDGRYTVLDQDEFDEAEARCWITSAQAAHARRVLDDLLRSAAAGVLVPPEAAAATLGL